MQTKNIVPRNSDGSLKVTGILKLVVLKNREYDQKLIDSVHRTERPPLSPNDFKCYAYPELRYKPEEVVSEDIQQANEMIEHIEQNNQQINENNVELDPIFAKANVDNQEYIDKLHEEIDKQAKLRFDEFNNSSTNELSDLINELKNNEINNSPLANDVVIDEDKFVIKQKISSDYFNNNLNNQEEGQFKRVELVDKVDEPTPTILVNSWDESNQSDPTAPRSVLDLIPETVPEFVYNQPTPTIIQQEQPIKVEMNNNQDENLDLKPKFVVKLDSDNNTYYKQVLDEVNQIKEETNTNDEFYDVLDEFINLVNKK